MQSKEKNSEYDLDVIYPRPYYERGDWGWRVKKLKAMFRYFNLRPNFIFLHENMGKPGETVLKHLKTNKVLIFFHWFFLKSDWTKMYSKRDTKYYTILFVETHEKYTRRIKKELLRLSEWVGVTQDCFKEEWTIPGYEKKIRRLPFPIVVGRRLNKDYCREILGIKTKYVLSSFGYRRRVKKQDKILEWFRGDKDITILFVGSATYAHRRFHDYLIKQSRKFKMKDRVKFSEDKIPEEDIDIWLNASDIMIYPHLAFAKCSIMDSLGRGSCVIVPNKGYFKDLAKEAPIILSSDFKETVKELLEDQERLEKIKQRAYEFARKNDFKTFIGKIVQEMRLDISLPPKIAICVPTKNVERELKDFLKTWSEVYYPKESLKFYFIDSSTDNTRKVIRELCKKYKLKFEIHDDPPFKNLINGSGWIADVMNKFKELLKDEEYVIIADPDVQYISPFTIVYLLDSEKDIVAPYVHTWPDSTRFYDKALFRKNNWLWGQLAPYRRSLKPVEMDSVGTLVLIKREIFDICKFENPLPTLQFLRNAKSLGFTIWALPYAKIFHRELEKGHKSIEQYVKEGVLPKEVLRKMPFYRGHCMEGEERKLEESKDTICPNCRMINTLYLENGTLTCRNCREGIIRNVIIVIADALRFDFFMESKIPRIFNKGYLYKCLTDQIQTGRAVPVLLTGKKRENIVIIELRPHWNPEASFSGSVSIQTITAFDMFSVKGYNVGYVNYDWHQQDKNVLLKSSIISLFGNNFPVRTLEQILSQEPFFGVLHFWTTHSPYTEGRFPEDCERVHKLLDKLVKQGNFKELRRIYAKAVRELERQLRTLYQILKERNLLDRTLIVITADHGENLGEHNRWGHAATLQEAHKTVQELLTKEVREIPLLFYNPLLERKWKGICKQEDILPSIFRLLGIEVSVRFDGKVVL